MSENVEKFKSERKKNAKHLYQVAELNLSLVSYTTKVVESKVQKFNSSVQIDSNSSLTHRENILTHT